MTSPAIRFNPTATALHHTDETNGTELRAELLRLTGKGYNGSLVIGRYYVAFMGEVYAMTDDQLRAAQGFV